jgi:class 3 adenylate cyclase
MAKLQRRNFRQPDEVRDIGRGVLQIVEIADAAIGKIAYEPGWRWSVDIGPRVGSELCEVYHIGVVISGRLQIEMRDGSTLTIGPDDAFEVPPGHDAWVLGDEPFVSIDTVGRRHFGLPVGHAVDRYLATILFVDVVGSTELARRLGDRAWRDLLAEHNAAARRVIDRHRGVEVGTIGDGYVATFNSPAHGVLAALDIGGTARTLELAVRAGVHTGEVERAGDDVRGIAVHHAARVAAAAGPGEVLVSTATKSLLAGAGIRLEPAGRHELKGIDEPDDLYRVIAEPPP